MRSSSSGRKETSALIGIWQAYAGEYLIVAGAAMLAAFGIPLLVAPMSRARLICWEIPPLGQLATFLGRSLGLFTCVVAVYAFKAAATPQAQPYLFPVDAVPVRGHDGPPRLWSDQEGAAESRRR